MDDLDLPQATRIAINFFRLSRDVAAYTEDECDRFLLLGLQYKALVSELVRKELTRVNSAIIEDANKRIEELTGRLEQELQGIKNFADTVKQAADLLAVVEKIIVIAAGL